MAKNQIFCLDEARKDLDMSFSDRKTIFVKVKIWQKKKRSSKMAWKDNYWKLLLSYTIYENNEKKKPNTNRMLASVLKNLQNEL